jgi:Fur family transcriptional regulator, peroxide stress response regulator
MAPVEDFREVCLRNGLALTHQRQVIWETLMALDGHPSPEEVYEQVRQRIPSISLATIYKNVKTFIDHGLLAEVSLHHGSARLETNMRPHHHTVCTRCRAIEDVDESDLEPIRFRDQAPAGFRVARYSVEVHGLCSSCARSTR